MTGNCEVHGYMSELEWTTETCRGAFLCVLSSEHYLILLALYQLILKSGLGIGSNMYTQGRILRRLEGIINNQVNRVRVPIS